MKCQRLFSRKNKKNVINLNLSSAEWANVRHLRGVNVTTFKALLIWLVLVNEEINNNNNKK